ncbi:TerB family tellurite resistance protein [Rhodopirellula sp. MGV]|uniref:TerB family tellurite resistance protein n=1 Tax=Rhodopirellula sp. MGV TaxID=2023130 RepID=UPI001E4B5112|nr:TerB family tellurite resistance protein [Rhodopirellula sp. MGV]
MNLTRTRDSGQFYCPGCRSNQEFRLRARRPFLTLYFIPVVPIGGAELFVVCSNCREKWDPTVLQVDPKGSEQVQRDQFCDEALKSAILVVLHDGFISETEIDALIRIGNHLLGQPIDREVLGEMCSIAEQNQIRASNYVTTVAKRWSPDQKREALQAMFLAATAEGTLDDSQIKLLTAMKQTLELDDRTYQAAIDEALQWEHV